ncbi:DUF6484 domain-containing protein [Acanthopleuribacter pedis]|uniref:DUF6484 domain-containing protein n=1 Tax=Acanthopleuribacter pedis TaxID=442870 RepID=A0A8J7U3A7_9BACT|nr:hypothetical protein [Acanthopleuribacter pedis]
MTDTPSPAQPEAAPAEETTATKTLLDQVDLVGAPKLQGIVLGFLSRIEDNGTPVITIPNIDGEFAAQATVTLDTGMVGRQVALMFVQGMIERPVVLGVIQNPEPVQKNMEVVKDGRKILLEAADEIELKCGKASLKMTREGKVIVKGTHLVSRSSGANKIKGASVLLN